MKTHFLVFPLIALSLCFAGSGTPLRAQEPPKTGSPTVAVNDETFLQQASQGGMTVAQLGKLAAQKATRSDVKEFGSLMATDHGKVNDELSALAKSRGITLPSQLDARHAGLVDKLSKLEGGQFDRAYVEDMVKGHQMMLANFTNAGQATKDQELKAFIAKTLPMVKAHLAKIEAIAAAKTN